MSRAGVASSSFIGKHISPLSPDQNPLQLRHISFERAWHARFKGQRFLDYPGAPVPAEPRFADDIEITETGAAYCGAVSAAGAGHRGEAGDFMT